MVPTSPIFVTFNDDAKGPLRLVPLTDAGGTQTHNVVATMPAERRLLAALGRHSISRRQVRQRDEHRHGGDSRGQRPGCSGRKLPGRIQRLCHVAPRGRESGNPRPRDRRSSCRRLRTRRSATGSTSSRSNTTTGKGRHNLRAALAPSGAGPVPAYIGPGTQCAGDPRRASSMRVRRHERSSSHEGFPSIPLPGFHGPSAVKVGAGPLWLPRTYNRARSVRLLRDSSHTGLRRRRCARAGACRRRHRTPPARPATAGRPCRTTAADSPQRRRSCRRGPPVRCQARGRRNLRRGKHTWRRTSPASTPEHCRPNLA